MNLLSMFMERIRKMHEGLKNRVSYINDVIKILNDKKDSLYNFLSEINGQLIQAEDEREYLILALSELENESKGEEEKKDD